MKERDFADYPKRINPVTYQPEVKILDEWVVMEVIKEISSLYRLDIIDEIRHIYSDNTVNEIERLLRTL